MIYWQPFTVHVHKRGMHPLTLTWRVKTTTEAASEVLGSTKTVLILMFREIQDEMALILSANQVLTRDQDS
jgi:hypothetical protein